MSRKVNMDLLEKKIEAKKKEVVEAKREWDKRTTELKGLMDKRDAILRQQILDLIMECGLSMEEVRRRLTGSCEEG